VCIDDVVNRHRYVIVDGCPPEKPDYRHKTKNVTSLNLENAKAAARGDTLGVGDMERLDNVLSGTGCKHCLQNKIPPIVKCHIWCNLTYTT